MRGCFLVYRNKDEDFDIRCDLHRKFAQYEVPIDQQELYVQVESTNNVIKSLHKTNSAIKEKYFAKLLSLARAGLVGNTAQPIIAQKSLIKLQEEMVLNEGQRIKNKYMLDLGLKALILFIIFGVITFLLNLSSNFDYFSMYTIAFMGAVLGTWISFGARKFEITFLQLSLIEEDMMSPWIRLIYIGLCATIFTLFLNTELVTIALGKISSASLKESKEIQMTVGVVCGLVESKIGISIYKKALELIPYNE